MFYYDKNWGTLIGYRRRYGSDQELNDHHFHYGYFIAAAATLAKFDPTWAKASQYGGMVDLLIRDANNYDRSDTRFPYLRDFDIYAGHDWASGHGSFASGNNQESSVGGDELRQRADPVGSGDRQHRRPRRRHLHLHHPGRGDRGVLVRRRQRPRSRRRSGTARSAWSGATAARTPPGSAPTRRRSRASTCCRSPAATSTWATTRPTTRSTTPRLVRNNGGEPTVVAGHPLGVPGPRRPGRGAGQVPGQPELHPEEGESRAHTFHWIRNLAALGNVDTTVTANHPLAAVFSKQRRPHLRRRQHHRRAAHGDVLRRDQARRAGREDGGHRARRPGAAATPGRAGDRPTHRRRPRRRDADVHPHAHADRDADDRPHRDADLDPDHPARRLPAFSTCTPTAASGRPAARRARSRLPAANWQSRRHAHQRQGVHRDRAQPRATLGGASTAFDLFVDAGTAVGNAIQAAGLLRPDRQRQLGPGGDVPLLRHRSGPGLRALHPERRPAVGHGHARQPDAAARSRSRSGARSATSPTTLGVGNQSVITLG